MAMPSHLLLQPYKPTDAEPFDRVKAAHLLNRAGFGGTAEEIDKVLKLGPAAAVDMLLDFKDKSAEEQGSDVPDLSAIKDVGGSFAEIRKKYQGKSEEEKKELRRMVMQANREAIQATLHWWLKRMAFGPHPLQEKLTLFWHGHFVTSDKDERSASAMWKQNELLRKDSVGNFRQFVRDISRDPAMLDYLNNTQNRKAHPNENYARELMELFTLGIGNYTETDVKEGARCFTGWAHDGDDYVFRKFDHDTGVKHLLGMSGNFNGDDAIDVILSQKAAARFIGTKLFAYFAYEEIDEKLGDAIGNEFREAKYELRPLVKMILTSKAFYSPEAIGSQIKCPIQLILGTVRMMDLNTPLERGVLAALNQMGQMPFSPPNVRGWPGGRMWINTSTLFVRYNSAMRLIDSPASRPNAGRLVDQCPAEDAVSIVDYWLDRLVQRPVADEKKTVLVAALGASPKREDSIRKMLQLLVSMPEYQLC
jgi:uncharacterized protein (DUF1800 family)